jgi:pSer/pThr/pTyr-binding forkhead associated (FHA) protein
MPGERIEVTDGPASGQQQDLEGELVIGRAADGFGALDGDPEISRRHAQITRTPEGRLYISDLGSTNGTFVNGNKIEGSSWLAPGDVVKVGQSTLKVSGGADDAGATRIGESPTSAPTRLGQSPLAAGGAAAGGAAAGAAAGDAAAGGDPPPPSGAPSPGSPPPAASPAPSPPRREPSAVPAAGAAAVGGAAAAGGPSAPPAGAPRAGGPGPGAPPPQRPGPGPSGGGGGRRGLLLGIIGGVVALLVVVAIVLAATGTFSSSSSNSKPPPLTIPSTAATTPSVPTTPTTTTSTPNTANKAAYIIKFDRIQRSYARLVAILIRKARNPNSVQDIITAFKRLKTLYGSTATRIRGLDTPAEIRGVSSTYTATLRVSSAGINLIIACARARSQSCYKRRLNSLSTRTRTVRKKFSRAFRARGYPVAVLAPS